MAGLNASPRTSSLNPVKQTDSHPNMVRLRLSLA
jgi:hypothetical protein